MLLFGGGLEGLPFLTLLPSEAEEAAEAERSWLLAPGP